VWKQYQLDVQAALDGISGEKVREAVEILRRAKFHNSNIWIIGNGGSAATASHFANDLLKMAGLRAVALTDMVPTITAYGNDEGWENMFAHALEKLLLPQDVVISISCSGNSKNVVEAVRMVRSHRLPALRTIVVTGADVNCQVAALQPDVIVYVPFKDIRVQEDCHLVICHAIAGALSNE
jgi:D-sedoheptulose 7-phosphate isomerase